jgi:hypothetical protein
MSVYFFIGLAVVLLCLLVGGIVVAATVGRVVHERDKQSPRKDEAE